VFANTFRSTWFRRNEILLHEICHAVFDLENDPVALDFVGQSVGTDISEARAQAFAQECLVPRSVLVHYTNQLGIRWHDLSEANIAMLVAQVHAEQAAVLRAACVHGMITEEQFQQYRTYDCAELLRELSEHSLTTDEYLKRRQLQSPLWRASLRNTTVGNRSLRLPVAHVQRVIETLNAGEISFGKAAEMLMMDKDTFAERYGELIHEAAMA
jgi:hypothetical protein